MFTIAPIYSSSESFITESMVMSNLIYFECRFKVKIILQCFIIWIHLIYSHTNTSGVHWAYNNSKTSLTLSIHILKLEKKLKIVWHRAEDRKILLHWMGS